MWYTYDCLCTLHHALVLLLLVLLRDGLEPVLEDVHLGLGAEGFTHQVGVVVLWFEDVLDGQAGQQQLGLWTGRWGKRVKGRGQGECQAGQEGKGVGLGEQGGNLGAQVSEENRHGGNYYNGGMNRRHSHEPILYFYFYQRLCSHSTSTYTLYQHYSHCQPSSMTQPRYLSYPHLLAVTLNCCLLSFNAGYSNLYLNSISFPQLARIFALPSDIDLSWYQGMLTGCLPITGALGAYYAHKLMDRLSRRECMLGLGVSTIGVCLVLMIADVRVLVVARLLQGLIGGVSTAITPVYIKEICPIELTASLGPWNQIAIIIGIASTFGLSYMLQLLMPVDVYWRVVFAIPMLTAGLMVWHLLRKYPYETPKWLYLRGQHAQVKKLLAIIYRSECVEEVYGELERDLGGKKQGEEAQNVDNLSQNFEETNKVKQLQVQLLTIEQQQANKKAPPQLLRALPTHTLAIIAAVHIAVANMATCMGPLLSYSGEMISEFFPLLEKLYPMLINLIAIVVSLLCIPFIKRVGRKLGLQLGFLTIGLSLVLLGLCFLSAQPSPLLICLLILHVRIWFCLTMGPLLWIYLAETVQPQYVSLGVMIAWLGNAVFNTLFPTVTKILLGGNPGWVFLATGAYEVAGWAVARAVLVETEGKGEAQIWSEFEERWRRLRGWSRAQ